MSQTFTPPFCPSRDCPRHLDPRGFVFSRYGTYRRAKPPLVVQRYRCHDCGVFFSRQSYCVSYWLKRPDLLVPVFERLLGCSSLRQIARDLECAVSTVMRLTALIGRHCLLFNWDRRPRTLDEPLVLDGFVSFEYSQYHPTDYPVIVGAVSHFFRGFEEAELRRSGRMTPYQRKKRAKVEEQHGRPDPQAVEKAVARLLEQVVPPGATVQLHSDDHRAYPRAFRRLPDRRFEQQVTSSKERRTTKNPLFPVNLLDLLIRHSGANHKRETIAWSKRRQGSIERLAVLQTWRNWLKSWSEKKQDETPAQRLGLTDRKWTVVEVLAKRLFPKRVNLPKPQERFYRREVVTRELAPGCRHQLTYAY